jgi:hypothetical protein
VHASQTTFITVWLVQCGVVLLSAYHDGWCDTAGTADGVNFAGVRSSTFSIHRRRSKTHYLLTKNLSTRSQLISLITTTPMGPCLRRCQRPVVQSSFFPLAQLLIFARNLITDINRKFVIADIELEPFLAFTCDSPSTPNSVIERRQFTRFPRPFSSGCRR